MQSRMYNTSGGVCGAAEDSKLYRDLVQREISILENMPNLWDTYSSVKEGIRDYIKQGRGFGGYADWTYGNFDGHISFRKDCDRDNVGCLEVGTWGLCIVCGCENECGLYCNRCEDDYCAQCDYCEERYYTDDLYEVQNTNGDRIRVCESCREEHFEYCSSCDTYQHIDNMNHFARINICDDCRDEYYVECDECDTWHHRNDTTLVHDHNGYDVYVCESCLGNYFCCDSCGDYYHINDSGTVYTADGSEETFCEDCRDGFETCPHCSETIEIREDGTCPHCGAVIEEDEEETE